MNTNHNPYIPEAGYQSSHDIPIVGYGITIESIYYWLVDHNLPDQPNKMMKNLHVSDKDDLDIDDIETYVDKAAGALLVEYVAASNIEFEAIMMYYPMYQEKRIEIESTKEIQNAIIKIAESMYEIPATLYPDFEKYIRNYTGEIITSDYC